MSRRHLEDQPMLPSVTSRVPTKLRRRHLAALQVAAALALVLFSADAGAQLVGSYVVRNGPFWGTNPPTYTCQEACALHFGGASSTYVCSTSPSTITRSAWVDGWGVSCQVQADTFKKATYYDCGSSGCSYSAFVSDHSCSQTNYCFRSGPSASAGGPYSVLQGSSVTLAASASGGAGGYSFAWDLDNDGAYDDATGASPAVSWTAFRGTGTRTVRVRVTDAIGAVTSATSTVNVSNVAPSPSFTFTPPAPADGVAIQFTGTVNDPGEGSGLETHSFWWDFGDGTGSPLRNPVKSYALPGTYTVRYTVTDSNGGVGSSVRAFAVWGSVPGGPYSVAQGTSLTLTGSAPNSPVVSYSWDLDDDGVFGDATIAAPTVPWTAFGGMGSRRVTLRTTDGRFTSIASTTVSVTNVAPSPAFAWTPAVPPRGAAVAFAVSTNDPGEPGGGETYSFAWTFGDGASSAQRNPVHAYGAPGTYTARVTVTDSNGGAGTTTRNVVVWGASAGGPYAVAQGSTVALAASAPNAPGPVTYAWDLDGDGIFDDAAGAAPVAASSVFGGFGTRAITVRATDAAGGVSIAGTTVSVWGASAGGPYALAQGETVQLAGSVFGSGHTGALSYRWDLDADGSFDDATGATPSLGWAAFGRLLGARPVAVQVTDGAGKIATASGTAQVSNVAPTASATFSPDPPKIAESVRFTGSYADPGSNAETYTFRWEFGDGTSSTQQSPSKAYANPGTYTARFTVTDSFGSTGTFTKVVTVVNVPPSVSVAAASGPQMSAIALTATVTSLSPANTAAGFDITWDFGDGSPVKTGKNLLEVTHVYEDAGTYTVRVTATDVQKSATVATALVTSRVVPPSVTVEDVRGAEGGPVAFDARITHVSPVTASAGYATKWEWADGTPALEGRDLVKPVKTFDDGGEYTVKLTVVDRNGGTTVALAKARIRHVAPTVALAPLRAAAAGAPVRFAATVTSPSRATTRAGFRLAWNFGDGTVASSGLTHDHAYCAAGSYTATVTATDKDGMQGFASVQVPVTNTAPRIVSAPPAIAVEDRRFEYAVRVAQPGCETLEYAVQGPRGMQVSPQGLVSWTPIYADVGEHEVVIDVKDRSGGRAQQRFLLEAVYRDGDHDGLPDTWEEQHGLDPNDPRDALESPAGDGRTNLDKWRDDLEPAVSAAPGAVTQKEPVADARVSTRTPALTVSGPDGSARELFYEFAIFEDAAMQRPLDGAGGRVRGTGGATFTVAASLQEDRSYWWRARALDGVGAGPWTEVRRLFVSAIEHAPFAPSLVTPYAGATVATATPELVAAQVRDPEGEALSYEFEIHASPELREPIASGRVDGVEGDYATWSPEAALADASWFWWRVRAVDAGGSRSAWSATGSFRVQTSAPLPETPHLARPLDGARVRTLSPVLSVATDARAAHAGRTYTFVVDTVASLDGPSRQVSEPVPEAAFFTSWTPPVPLADHVKHFWSVTVTDGEFTSAPALGSFLVNALEVAPNVPNAVSPADGAQVELHLTLTIENTDDANADALTYDFELLDAEGKTVLARRSAIPPGADGRTSWDVEGNVRAGSLVKWRARAVDATGLAGEWTPLRAVTLKQLPGCSAVDPGVLALVGLGSLLVRRRRRG